MMYKCYYSTMPKLDDQISTLQERLAQLKLRQQRIEARQRAIASVRERKVEMRRKILAGAVVLERMQQSETDRHLMVTWLDQALSRAADRSLFGLEPLPPGAPGKSQTTPGFVGNDGDGVGQIDAAAAGAHGQKE